MRRYLFATSALLMIATPAAAKDGSWYVGFDLGAFFPKDPSGGNVFVDYTTVDVPSGLPGLIPAPVGTSFSNAFGFNAKTGWDADMVAGHDFGMFRVEGELGYKHAKLDFSGVRQDFIDQINLDLNRPVVNPLILPPLTVSDFNNDFNFDDSMHAWSLMLNGLLDFGGAVGLQIEDRRLRRGHSIGHL